MAYKDFSLKIIQALYQRKPKRRTGPVEYRLSPPPRDPVSNWFPNHHRFIFHLLAAIMLLKPAGLGFFFPSLTLNIFNVYCRRPI